MHLSIVSSLDSHCRQTATFRLGQTHSNSVVVHHDLLEGSIVLRRMFSAGVLTEREETVLEHGCLSCTMRLDIVFTVERLLGAGYDHAVLGLPPGVSVGMAVAALNAGLDRPVTVDNAVLAIDPAEVEDQISDRHTLYESGFTLMPGDDRTSGEFLIGELSHADTVMIQRGLSSELAGSAQEEDLGWRRGLELMSQLAPHATVTGAGDEFRSGCYDALEALSRCRLGEVRVPVQGESGNCTVLHRVERPLHPGRFRQVLPRLAAGSADAVLGWHPTHGDRGTVVAVTGRSRDIDAAEIRALLDGCQLSDEEMQLDFDRLPDPLDLRESL